MALDTIMSSFVQTLSGYLGIDGTILPDKEELAQEAVDSISQYSGINIAIDANDRISVDGVSYTSIESMQNAIETQFTEVSDLSGYFYQYDYEIGVLGDTGGSELARKIMAASGVTLTYTENTESKIHLLSCDNFRISIHEGKTEDGEYVYPQIQLEVRISQSMVRYVEVLNTSAMTILGKPYVYYYILKGSGDFFVKTIAMASDDQLPDQEDADDFFKDVKMGCYYYNSDEDEIESSTYGSDSYGGFAMIAMVDHAEGSSGDGGFALSLFNTHGAPLWVGSDFLSPYSTEGKFLMPNDISKSLTKSTETTAALAPIYAPSSVLRSSRNSFWGIISAFDDVYDLVIGVNRYRYDHGFCLGL